MPEKVTGKSIVLPLLVMVWVPLVAPNVKALLDEVNVMPVDRFKLPYIITLEPNAPNVPANPVKSKLLTRVEAVKRRLKAYVPPVKLKLILFASDTAPGVTVIAVDPVEVTLTTLVPVVVNPVTLSVLHTVPVPEQLMFPVPKAIVRVFALFEINAVVVNVRLLRSNVPRVSVAD